mmetsp:Transcript_13056/g.30832  ORF Transcript_13056/g.30832 Transcript_13056/m.30832 type:complete len:224 (-) Transcript_13056:544-1215(-)
MRRHNLSHETLDEVHAVDNTRERPAIKRRVIQLRRQPICRGDNFLSCGDALWERCALLHTEEIVDEKILEGAVDADETAVTLHQRRWGGRVPGQQRLELVLRRLLLGVVGLDELRGPENTLLCVRWDRVVAGVVAIVARTHPTPVVLADRAWPHMVTRLVGTVVETVTLDVRGGTATFGRGVAALWTRFNAHQASSLLSGTNHRRPALELGAAERFMRFDRIL